jgi:transposase
LAIIHAANIQDRDGGILLMAALLKEHPLLRKLYADGGYQGPKFRQALSRIMRKIKVEIVKRSDAASAFAVLPRRWVVERTIAWLNRCRRLAKDWECLNRNALAFLRWASVRLMLSLALAISCGVACCSDQAVDCCLGNFHEVW